jgi:hypothetical protein
MDGRRWIALVVSLAVVLLAAPAAFSADPATAPQNGGARLLGAQEVPVILSSGQGRFSFRLQRGKLFWELSYSGLQGDVLQAHIHVGQSGVNGGIAVFLCSNLNNGPAGTQACPASPATISGISDADDVLAVAAQGLPAGDFQRFAAALRNGVTYANVHSSLFQGGEIRGQLPHDH